MAALVLRQYKPNETKADFAILAPAQAFRTVESLRGEMLG